MVEHGTKRGFRREGLEISAGLPVDEDVEDFLVVDVRGPIDLGPSFDGTKAAEGLHESFFGAFM